MQFFKVFSLVLFCLGCTNAFGQSVSPMPNARCGLAQTIRWVGDITAAGTIYYTNDQTVYSDAGPWSANSQYDEFYSGSGICHQAWSARSGGALPAPTTCTGVYICSAQTDANGHFNQQKTAGGSRRWDVWNAWNQKQIDLQVEDGNTNQSVTAQQNAWNPITSNSYATFIIGLPEQANCLVLQQIYPYTAPGGVGNGSWGTVACGWGSQFGSTVSYTWPSLGSDAPGTWGQQGLDSWITNQNPGGGYLAPGGTAIADYGAVDLVGTQIVYEVVNVQTVTGSGAFVKFAGVNGVVQRIMHIRFPG